MLIRNNPAPPNVRFAATILYQATARNANEVRLIRGKDEIAISLDGESLSPLKAELFPYVSKAFLNFANIRLWPWSKSLSGKRLAVKFESTEMASSWNLETPNIKTELILRQI